MREFFVQNETIILFAQGLVFFSLGFAVWLRRDGNGRNVTFPARQFTVHGERRSFALLRPVVDPNAQGRIRDAVLRAYDEMEQQVSEASAS